MSDQKPEQDRGRGQREPETPTGVERGGSEEASGVPLTEAEVETSRRPAGQPQEPGGADR